MIKTFKAMKDKNTAAPMLHITSMMWSVAGQDAERITPFLQNMAR